MGTEDNSVDQGQGQNQQQEQTQKRNIKINSIIGTHGQNDTIAPSVSFTFDGTAYTTDSEGVKELSDITYGNHTVIVTDAEYTQETSNQTIEVKENTLNFYLELTEVLSP